MCSFRGRQREIRESKTTETPLPSFSRRASNKESAKTAKIFHFLLFHYNIKKLFNFLASLFPFIYFFYSAKFSA